MQTFTISELYKHIPRLCCIMNKWCLVYYTGQSYTTRKTQSQTEIRESGPSGSYKEEPITTFKTETKSQKDFSDDGDDGIFETVEEKDAGSTSKRKIDRESEEPMMKKQKLDKDNYFDMESMIQQLTTVVRELRNMSSAILLMSSGSIELPRLMVLLVA